MMTKRVHQGEYQSEDFQDTVPATLLFNLVEMDPLVREAVVESVMLSGSDPSARACKTCWV